MLTEQEAFAARITVGRQIMQGIVDDPFWKFLGLREQAPTILKTIEEVLLAWSPTKVTEEALRSALKQYEFDVRVRLVRTTGQLSQCEAEQLAAFQLLTRTGR